jgi:carbonic anhydrase
MSLSPITSNIENSTFYFYRGSSTVGDCDEDMLWYVSNIVLPIRSSDLKVIQSMSVGEPNNKPISNLNSRMVYAINSTCN